MLKILLLYFYINLAYGLDNACVEKHHLPVNENNFNVLKRYIKTIYTTTFGFIPNSGFFENNGKTVMIRYFYDRRNATATGGPYGNEKYIIEFMYFNWLHDNYTAVGGLPIELHLMFFNRKYGTYENASKMNFGLTVWSFRYKLSDEVSTRDIYDSLVFVREPNAKIHLYYPQTFLKPLFNLIDLRLKYFIYQGRLISAIQPCSTDVMWLEFPDMLKINSKELKRFQKLLATDMTPMMGKYHMATPPNGPIYQNFESQSEEYDDLSLLERFNATSNDNKKTNLAIRYNGNLFIVFGILLHSLNKIK